jgi:hypothetical protein
MTEGSGGAAPAGGGDGVRWEGNNNSDNRQHTSTAAFGLITNSRTVAAGRFRFLKK